MIAKPTGMFDRDREWDAVGQPAAQLDVAVHGQVNGQRRLVAIVVDSDRLYNGN
ncbi:MAG: hypothetical protein WCP28_03415 [Actinomycetes bacterium]